MWASVVLCTYEDSQEGPPECSPTNVHTRTAGEAAEAESFTGVETHREATPDLRQILGYWPSCSGVVLTRLEEGFS